jgi:hypothetical protein
MSDPNLKMTQAPKDISSALALANVATIAAGVMRGLASQSISDSIAGSPLLQDKVAQMVCSRVIKNLQKRDQAAKQMRLNGYK